VKRVLLALLVLVVLAVGAAAAFVLYRKHQGRNVHGSSSVEFVTTQAPTRKRTPLELRTIPWPMYGLDDARTRFADGVHLRPPFRKLWLAGGTSLLEFPPAVGYGRLFLSNNSGSLFALGARNGGRAWTYKTHRCTAASPAINRGTVFASFMNRGACNQTNPGLDGLVAALSVGLGKVRWTTTIGPTESSPLVANGRLFVGAYDGHVYALDERTGRLVWRASAQPRLGSTGTFYSTPAVAYGRVYLGSTDGKVYSFGATSGKLRWSHGTGGYVYSSPAVWNKRVYAGSYDHRLYCFDAATGDVRWSFEGNGPISGSPTVIDGIVYFATLKGRTYGLNALTGRQMWSFPDGKYSPIVADTKRFYLVGYARVYGMVPR